MSAGAQDTEDEIVGINVTPLVDITLVLLIVFLVTAKLITQQGIPMELPRAATAGATQTILTISVTPEGKLFANGQPVSEGELASIARRSIQENPETRTVIQAAAAARHDAVLGAIDSLRAGGVVKIAFASDPTRELSRSASP